MYGGVGFRFASVLYVWKNYKILFIFDLDTLILLSRTYDTNVHTSTMLLNENALLPFIHFNSTFLIASGATLLSWVCIMAATLVVSLALSEKLYNVLCLERELHFVCVCSMFEKSVNFKEKYYLFGVPLYYVVATFHRIITVIILSSSLELLLKNYFI